MEADRGDLTQEEVRTRIRASGLRVEEDSLQTIQMILNTALAPVRRLDFRLISSLEPASMASTFDSRQENGPPPGVTDEQR